MAVFGGPDGKRIDGGPSDRHYEILASHGRTDAIPVDRRSEFVPQAPQSTGSGYISFKDRFDGGGPGRSGAMFSSKSLDGYGVPLRGYVSQAAINKMQANNPDKFKADFGTGIGGLSNNLGFRPYGSYGQEQALGSAGTNIGTSGLANIMTGAANPFLQMLGFNNKSMANPNLPLGATLGGSPVPMLRPANFSVPANPISPTTGVSASPQGLPENAAAPVQAIMNGGLVGLRRYMYGGMV